MKVTIRYHNVVAQLHELKQNGTVQSKFEDLKSQVLVSLRLTSFLHLLGDCKGN